MKKLLAGVLSIALCLTLCACSPSPAAIVVGGHSVDASGFAFYIHYNLLNLSSQYGYAPDTLFDDAMTEQVKNDALDQAVTAQIVRMQCAEGGLSLSDEQRDELKVDKKDFTESLGGKYAYLEFLRESAMTDRSYDAFQEDALYYDLLYDDVCLEATEYYTDENLRQFFSENYITVKYIRLGTIDGEGNPLSELDSAAQLTQANAILEQAKKEGADFDALMAQYNDDPMMENHPEGLVVGIADTEGSAYLEPAFSLAEGEVGGVYSGADGYYIVKRTAVSASYFEENQSDILQSATDWYFTQSLAQWKRGCPGVTTTAVYKKINLENYMDYVK